MSNRDLINEYIRQGIDTESLIEFNQYMLAIYPDDDTANKRLYRKRDWHKNKGKRRVRDGYKERYV